MSNPTPAEVSVCCRASFHSVSSDEGTGYYVCEKCLRPCDPAIPAEENKKWEEQTFRELVRTVLDGRAGDVEELLNRIIAEARRRALREADVVSAAVAALERLERIEKRIDERLVYCLEQNGQTGCKNCGLNGGDLL